MSWGLIFWLALIEVGLLYVSYLLGFIAGQQRAEAEYLGEDD